MSLSNDDTLIANFRNSVCHSTVICGWHLAFAANGFEKQLGRCNTTNPLQICNDKSVYSALEDTYSLRGIKSSETNRSSKTKCGTGNGIIKAMEQERDRRLASSSLLWVDLILHLA